MIFKTENEYDHDTTDSFDDSLTVSENVVANRRLSFDDFDGDYMDALRYLSIRVLCPFCKRPKGQLCVGAMKDAPAHKSRMRLVELKSKKAYDNLHFAMKSEKWKGDMVIVKIKGKWKIVDCSDVKWRKLVEETYGI